MKNRIVIIFLLTFLAVSVFLSCETEKDEELSAQDWIEKGLVYLGKSDGTNAYLAFDRALEIQKSNRDAQYGQVLANLLLFKDTIDVLLEMFIGEFEELEAKKADAFCSSLNECDLLDSYKATIHDCLQEAPMGLPKDVVNCVINQSGNCSKVDKCITDYLPPDEDLCINACDRMDRCGFLDHSGWGLSECEEYCPSLYVSGSLECLVTLTNCELAQKQCFPVEISPMVDTLKGPMDDVITEMFRHMDHVLGSATWTFDIPKFNFTILDLLFHPDLSGQNDTSDAYFISSYVNAIGGALDLLFGVNVDINPVVMAAIITDYEDIFSELSLGDTEQLLEILEYLDHLIELILGDPAYSEFLLVKEGAGYDRIEKSGNEIGEVFGNLVYMIDSINEETDDQSDDAIRYIDINENGIWDDDEKLLIPGVGAFEKELAFALREVLLALKINFTEGVPFSLTSMNELFVYFDMYWVTIILDALYVFDIGEVDLATFFNDPTEAGLRDLLADVKDVLRVAILIFEMI